MLLEDVVVPVFTLDVQTEHVLYWLCLKILFLLYLCGESSSGLLLPPYVFNGFVAHLTFREVDGQSTTQQQQQQQQLQQTHTRGNAGNTAGGSSSQSNPHPTIPSKTLRVVN